MTDILGPADAENAVTMRPAETRTFSSQDTWFEDCTSPTADDGTEIQASWLNDILAKWRSVWRMNGTLADGTTKVVPEVGTDDDGLTKSLQQLVQRGQVIFAVDTGVKNALVVTLSPALKEYKAGVTLRVKAKFSNDGPTTIVVSGLGERAIKRPSLQDLSANDIPANGVIEICDDGTQFQLISAGTGSGGGTQGPQGIQGPQGVPGIQGPQGIAGPQGVQGVPGMFSLTLGAIGTYAFMTTLSDPLSLPSTFVVPTYTVLDRLGNSYSAGTWQIVSLAANMAPHGDSAALALLLVQRIA